MPDTAVGRSEKRPFTGFLQDQRKGALHAELSDELAAVVAGVVKHGKAGKLTLTFTIKPEGDEAISVAAAYSSKVPTPPAKPSLFFADDTGNVSRQRLNQMEFNGLSAVHGGGNHSTQHGGEEAASTS